MQIMLLGMHVGSIMENDTPNLGNMDFAQEARGERPGRGRPRAKAVKPSSVSKFGAIVHVELKPAEPPSCAPLVRSARRRQLHPTRLR